TRFSSDDVRGLGLFRGFTPDGGRLLFSRSADKEKLLTLLDLQGGNRRQVRLKGFPGVSYEVPQVSPDGRLIAHCAEERQGSFRLYLHELSGGALLLDHPLPRGAGGEMAFTPDGRRLVTAGRVALVWDLDALLRKLP